MLDSTVIVAAERTGATARRVIDHFRTVLGDQPATLSVITAVELAHGITRADTLQRREMREQFLNQLLSEITIEPVTVAVAVRAGKIDGEMAMSGSRIALGDLLIGATALELGFSVVTANVKHFSLIPGLDVRTLSA